MISGDQKTATCMKSQQSVKTVSTPREVRPSSREATRFFWRSGFREVTCERGGGKGVETRFHEIFRRLQVPGYFRRFQEVAGGFKRFHELSGGSSHLLRVNLTHKCNSLEVLKAQVWEF